MTIELFDIEGSRIRFGVTEDGTPYSVAADFAKAMGYRQATDATRLLDDGESGQQIVLTRSANGVDQRREMNVIYEDGMWELVFRSTLPGAKAIKARVKEILKQLRRTGMVVDEKRITEDQIQAGRELLDSIAQKRLEEKQDYRAILHALKLGGAVSEEYRLVQNTLYLSLFGKTAYQIRTTQPQRTGTPRKRGNGFRKSSIAKDFLTEQQLAVLNSTVLATIAQIQLRHPDGATAAQMLDAIHRAISIIRIGGAA